MIRLAPNDAVFKRDLGNLISRAKNPRALLMNVGREGSNILKRHFRQKDKNEANKLNPGRRQHLWLQISRGVQNPVQRSLASVSISINHPVIAQKVFGGPIVAKRVRNLAIPVSPDAAGRTPATFEHETGRKLFVLQSTGKLLLASRVSESGTAQVEFILKRRVLQRPDPTALPDEKSFSDALIARAEKVLERELNQKQPPTS